MTRGPVIDGVVGDDARAECPCDSGERVASRLFHDLLVGDVPGDGEDVVGAVIPGANVLDEVGPLHLLDEFDAAADIPAARLLAVDRPDR